MYTRPVVLNSVNHKLLKIAPVTSYDFAKEINSSIIGGHEFLEAAKYYPIVFSADGSLTVCVDSSYAGFDREDGERLFADDGDNSPMLGNALKFLRLYQDQFAATKAFIKHLKDLNIFKAVDANITLAGGQRFTVPNLLMVDEEAMIRLADKELGILARQGYLAWIYVYLYSLTNFSRILNRAGKLGAN